MPASLELGRTRRRLCSYICTCWKARLALLALAVLRAAAMQIAQEQLWAFLSSLGRDAGAFPFPSAPSTVSGDSLAAGMHADFPPKSTTYGKLRGGEHVLSAADQKKRTVTYRE
jgi:hypothetical protein